MTVMLELSSENHHIATLKTLSDVRIGLIAGALRLPHESFHSAQRLSPALTIPASTGRIFLTEIREKRLIPHIAFKVEKRGSSGSRCTNPSYFCIVIGRTAAFFRIWDRSHNHLRYTNREQIELSKILKLKRKTIPSNSFLVCRGDIIHARASEEEDPKHKARCHVY